MGRRSATDTSGTAIVERPESQANTSCGLDLKLDSSHSSTVSRHDTATDGSKAQC